MKTITEIRNEKPQYFVCINGVNEFESESLKECKDYLASFLKHVKTKKVQIENTYDYYIGMYTITIE